MEKKYINIFNGYRGAYGVADWTNAQVDPETGKLRPDYRWTFEPFTDQVYIKHLNGEESVGIQPTNEDSKAMFAVIDIDPKDYKDFSKKTYLDKIQEYKLPLIPIESKSGGLH